MYQNIIFHQREQELDKHGFLKNWSDNKIKEAGEFVANLSENKSLADGVIGFGEYDGVRVGIIKTNGKVGTIFPDADLQP